MRLFVALDLSDRARSEAAAIAQRIAARINDDRSLRFVRPEQLHLTLSFIGEVDEAKASAIANVLAAGIDQAPFTVAFRGLGVFPPSGAPRALWIGVRDGAEQVVALQERVAEKLAGVGVPREERPFSPHLTLARWRQSRSSDRGRALAAGGEPAVGAMTVDSITLYQSRLSSSGPTYVVLSRPSLTGTSRGNI